MRLSSRWLSSQILLLVIAGWVVGLAIIHHFWLTPSLATQLAHQQSSAAVRWIEQGLAGLAGERKSLARLGETLAEQPAALARKIDRLNQPDNPDSPGRWNNVGILLCGPDRKVRSVAGWLAEPTGRSPADWRVGQTLDYSPLFPPNLETGELTGLLSASGRACIFSRQPVADSAGQGYLVLVRPIDWPMLQDLSSTTGVSVMVTAIGPAIGPAGQDQAVRHWTADSGSLSAAIDLKDSLGQPIARLQACGSTLELSGAASSISDGYLVQLLWLICSALATFVVIYLLFIRPLAILVHRLSDKDLAGNRGRLSAGLFAETGILARKFGEVMDRIVTLSETDSLTGLTNRRQLQLLLEHEFRMSQRHNAPLAAMMIDVDLFKQVNDRHGHLIGDEVLQMVARTLREVARKSDVCGRYGGEEFAIVLPQTSMEQAAVLGERIRDQILRRVVVHDQELVKVTVSVGVASMPQLACHRPEDLLDLADRALYAAKNAGRNRIMLANELLATPIRHCTSDPPVGLAATAMAGPVPQGRLCS